MLIGAIAGGVAVLAFSLLQSPRKCPDCATPLPKFRTPASGQQALAGGWTCPKCGIEIDRKGQKRG
jgi:rubredoxin